MRGSVVVFGAMYVVGWQLAGAPTGLIAAWLLAVFRRAERADTRPIFLIHHPELLGELKLQAKGVEKSGLRYYTFNELKPSLSLMEKESKTVGAIKPELRTPYQRSLMALHTGLTTYLRLKNSLKPERAADFAAELAQAAAEMQVGQIAGPIETVGGGLDKITGKYESSGPESDKKATGKFLTQAPIGDEEKKQAWVRDKIAEHKALIARNAAQAMKGEGKLTFKTRLARPVTMARTRYQHALVVQITDTGPGIPENMREKIFYPLVSGREGGTGLGLTLAQTFVTQHGGTISFDSQPGSTTFTLQLPINNAESGKS